MAEVAPYPDLIQAAFVSDLCQLLVACNIAWAAVDHPFWQHLFATWLPAVILPSHQVLAGRILEQEAQRVVVDMKARVKGRFATSQSDGWKNIVRTSLVASMINVEYSPYLLNAVDISSQPKNAENLLEIVKAEIKYCVEVLKTKIVAWCMDSSGESVKMRRLLHNLFLWIVVVACWAHQLNLVVSDYIKLKLPFMAVFDCTVEVIKWFNNHSQALRMLKEETKARLGKAYALVMSVITRWTTHYLSCRRLLLLETPMRTLAVSANEVLVLCGEIRLKRSGKQRKLYELCYLPISGMNCTSIVQCHLQPLAIAVNTTQANNARLDTILLTLGHLYHLFSDPAYEAEQTDQDIFILAVVLNPYLRTKCFCQDNAAVTEALLSAMLEWCYKRMLSMNADIYLFQSFTNYLHYLGKFSEDHMALEKHHQLTQNAETDVNLVTIWRQLDMGGLNGRNGLVALAMHILSIVLNSAATERIFSAMGIVHSDIRNRLDAERVCHTVLLK
ncbi:hypothetical protein WOLCODRAFT_84289, partial [Wolfiporia cocos MD-104 SS10]